MNIGGFGSAGSAFARANSNSFDVVARWVETLHGHGEFRDALEQLITLLAGDSVNVTRTSGAACGAKTVAVFDRDAGKLFSNRRVRCFGPAIAELLGIHMPTGSVWVLSEMIRDGIVDLPADIQDDIDQLGLRDVAIVPLEDLREGVDYLELHFRSDFAEHDRVLLAALGSTLSKSWKARLPGTAERLIAQSRFRRAVPAQEEAETAILDVSNPAGLSRSEYRICMLVREGLLTKEIAAELNIRKSTMRSHLRSIYAKTGVNGHVELIHALSRGESSTQLGRLAG